MHLGFPEIGLILVIILVIFGAGKLPQIGGALGKTIREFKREKDGIAEHTRTSPDANAGASQIMELKAEKKS